MFGLLTALTDSRTNREVRRRCETTAGIVDTSSVENGRERGRGLLNPDGNERLTAAVGLVLIVLTIAELATNVLGLHQLLSVHVFIGLVLIPPVLLKLASTGWRFARYYTGSKPYTAKGAPELPMRLLAPLLESPSQPRRSASCIT